jgi:hypothetical protein
MTTKPMPAEGKNSDKLEAESALRDAAWSPKIVQLLLTPNDSNWQGMLLGLADNGDTYRLDHADGWVIWFDGIPKQNDESIHPECAKTMLTINDTPKPDTAEQPAEVVGGDGLYLAESSDCPERIYEEAGKRLRNGMEAS